MSRISIGDVVRHEFIGKVVNVWIDAIGNVMVNVELPDGQVRSVPEAELDRILTMTRSSPSAG